MMINQPSFFSSIQDLSNKAGACVNALLEGAAEKAAEEKEKKEEALAAREAADV